MTLLIAYIVGTSTWLYLSAPCTGVIGVVYNQHGVVRHVFPNSPADKAGIEVGDIIHDRRSTRGKPETEVLVKWKRDEIENETVMVRTCTDNLQRDKW